MLIDQTRSTSFDSQAPSLFYTLNNHPPLPSAVMDSFTTMFASFPAQIEGPPANEEGSGGSGGQAYCVVA